MLEPYTVLDFTDARGEIGPMLLGDLGADVIRVEHPGGNSARLTLPQVKELDEDLRSLQFIAFNRNKRSIVLDPATPADCTTLEALVARADFIFESYPSDNLSAYGIDFDAARRINPNIVYVRLSPFGADGPHSSLIADDLVLASMGGPVSLQGVPERAPIRVSVPQAWRHAGVEAVAGSLVAHAKMIRSGEAQYVDLSAQSVMTWTMLNAMDAYAIQGADFQRNGSSMNNGVLNIQIVYPTSDGYIVALPLPSMVMACTPWMIEDGILDESYRNHDWAQVEEALADPERIDETLTWSIDVCQRFFALHSKQELFHYGLKHGDTLAPVNTLDELLALEHMGERDYWEPLTLGSRTVNVPGLWSKPSNQGLSIRRGAPRLNEHGDEIRAALRYAQPSPRPEPTETSDELPFAGIKVTDFTWVGVGPISSKYLADHGADVIRIESESRPDVVRASGPFRGGEPGLNRSQFFGDFNTSKRSLALDLKSPEAIELAKQLITESDVMIESFASGAIGRMGLGYEAVSQINPSLIMISTCLMGQTGSASGMAGYGYHAAALAGFYEVTGWPDLAPSGPWIAYTDTIAPRFVSVLLASALDRRRRTGEGCFIDVAQIETALHFLAPEFLNLQINGESAGRLGNRSAYYAPQGCYPCSGEDDWCAIVVETDQQWQALADITGINQSYPDHAARLAAHDLIDAEISRWTSAHSRDQVMETLQAAGIPSGRVQRSSDLLNDPQYAHRNFYRYFDHQEMGHIPYAGHQYRISGYDNAPRGPAPCLGQHTFEILSDYLGLSDEDIAAAYASGIVT